MKTQRDGGIIPISQMMKCKPQKGTSPAQVVAEQYL